MWKPFVKFLKALSSNTDPGAIACGFSCGILLGFMPKTNLLWYILCIFILFMRIQRGTYALAIIIGSLFAPLLDPAFNQVGYVVLTWNNAIPVYAWLLNVPFIAFTKFHNSVVMGSLICGIAAYIPLYFLMRLIIWLWRKFIAGGFNNLRVIKAMKNASLVKKLHNAIEVVDAVK